MKYDDLPKTGRGDRPLILSNALIESVSIDTERCLTAWLMLSIADGGACGFGGYNLGPGRGSWHAGEFLARCMTVGGSERWEGLKGRPVRVLHEGLGGGIVAVGHFLKDDWFCPKLEWKN